jgi:hypothetical protein
MALVSSSVSQDDNSVFLLKVLLCLNEVMPGKPLILPLGHCVAQIKIAVVVTGIDVVTNIVLKPPIW